MIFIWTNAQAASQAVRFSAEFAYIGPYPLFDAFGRATWMPAWHVHCSLHLESQEQKPTFSSRKAPAPFAGGDSSRHYVEVYLLRGCAGWQGFLSPVNTDSRAWKSFSFIRFQGPFSATPKSSWRL